MKEEDGKNERKRGTKNDLMDKANKEARKEKEIRGRKEFIKEVD
jgi:hypothetical protein